MCLNWLADALIARVVNLRNDRRDWCLRDMPIPFQPGEHRHVAVKVIDFRGNEVVRVMPLDKEE